MDDRGSGRADGTRPSAVDRRTGRLLVLGQFVLIGLIVLLPSRQDWPVSEPVRRVASVVALAALALMVLAATSLGRGLTAQPLPNAHAELRTGGLYRWVRHPIYSGLLLFAVAEAVPSGSVFRAGAAALLLLLITAKARWEEGWLRERFEGYAEYAARTPRFVPWRRRR